jgi:hypothetical protein
LWLGSLRFIDVLSPNDTTNRCAREDGVARPPALVRFCGHVAGLSGHLRHISAVYNNCVNSFYRLDLFFWEYFDACNTLVLQNFRPRAFEAALGPPPHTCSDRRDHHPPGSIIAETGRIASDVTSTLYFVLFKGYAADPHCTRPADSWVCIGLGVPTW